MLSNWYICDPSKGNHPIQLTAELKSDLNRAMVHIGYDGVGEETFVFINGQMREVAEINSNKNGTQVQLF